LLVRVGVAAGGHIFLGDRALGFGQARTDLVQFALILDLDAEMFDAGRGSALRDREVDARIVEHPFGVIGLFETVGSAANSVE
jgi:hypothetical protein